VLVKVLCFYRHILNMHTDAHTFETGLVKWINGCVSNHYIFQILNAVLYFV